jgi:hypothetical protein
MFQLKFQTYWVAATTQDQIAVKEKDNPANKIFPIFTIPPPSALNKSTNQLPPLLLLPVREVVMCLKPVLPVRLFRTDDDILVACVDKLIRPIEKSGNIFRDKGKFRLF